MPIPIMTSIGPVLSPLISNKIPPILCSLTLISFGHFRQTFLMPITFNALAVAMPIYNDNNPEDIDTDAEDHAYDALRYGCMSRPMHTSFAKRFNQPARPQFTPVDRFFGY